MKLQAVRLLNGLALGTFGLKLLICMKPPFIIQEKHVKPSRNPSATDNGEDFF